MLLFPSPLFFFLRANRWNPAVHAPDHGTLPNPVLWHQLVDRAANITQQPRSFPATTDRLGAKPKPIQSVSDACTGTVTVSRSTYNSTVGDLLSNAPGVSGDDFTLTLSLTPGSSVGSATICDGTDTFIAS